MDNSVVYKYRIRIYLNMRDGVLTLDYTKGGRKKFTILRVCKRFRPTMFPVFIIS